MRVPSVAFLLTILAAAPAAAQLTPEQARAVDEKKPVLVTVADGTWKGRLVHIDADSVTIEPDGWPARTLPLSSVLRIEAKKHDSPADGAFIGGVVMTLWCLFVCAQGAPTTGDAPGIVIGGAMMGIVVGGVIDARHTGTVSLYKRPAATPARKSPGLFFTVRF